MFEAPKVRGEIVSSGLAGSDVPHPQTSAADSPPAAVAVVVAMSAVENEDSTLWDLMLG